MNVKKDADCFTSHYDASWWQGGDRRYVWRIRGHIWIYLISSHSWIQKVTRDHDSIVGFGFMLYHGSWFYRQEKCCHNHDSIEIFACPPILYYRLPSPARPWNSEGYIIIWIMILLLYDDFLLFLKLDQRFIAPRRHQSKLHQSRCHLCQFHWAPNPRLGKFQVLYGFYMVFCHESVPLVFTINTACSVIWLLSLGLCSVVIATMTSLIMFVLVCCCWWCW